MANFLPLSGRIALRQFLLAFLLLTGLNCLAQLAKGKDGAATLSTAGNAVLNRYTTLVSSVSSGSLSVTVTDINQLKGSYVITNGVNLYATDAISKGDLVMIVQVQGADVATTDDINFGTITAYNNTGNYEVRTVFNVTGNTISLCQNLTNAYSQGGRARTQVIRIPRFTSFTINAGAIVTGQVWNGTTGGVVAIETSNTMTVNGKISADAIGFRGGVDDKNNSVASGLGLNLSYRTTSTLLSGGKGESIAGNTADYNSTFSGGYGRGAIANGGGGGNGHNTGGGGGSNAGFNNTLTPWNGTGLKSKATAAWANAWEMEYAGFSNDVSVGGGRGGYSYSSSNQDGLVLAPGSLSWGGDHRRNIGGLGGRPLDYNTNKKLFMGGGGGSGDGNNNAAGYGGAGGGIVFLLANLNLTGSGSVTANGQVGFDTEASNKDAAGGGGGGGAIRANITGSISGITFSANGGAGGRQLNINNEAEGPGGGGGGGFISTTSAAISTVDGGGHGISQSSHITEFLPNGATSGNKGTIVNSFFLDVSACDAAGYVLSTTLLQFQAVTAGQKVVLNWTTRNEVAATNYQLEKSSDGVTYSPVAIIMGTGEAAQSYSYTDKESRNSITYYRIAIIEKDAKLRYSETRIVKEAVASGTLSVFPNPAMAALGIRLPSSFIGTDVLINVYDMSGKEVFRQTMQDAGSAAVINVAHLKSAPYILTATNGNGKLQERFIKN